MLKELDFTHAPREEVASPQLQDLHECGLLDTPPEPSFDMLTSLAGNAILGANNIIRRHGSRLTGDQRAALLAIIEEQSRHLAQLP